MKDYILSCGSVADLTNEHLASRNIEYICYHYEVDGEFYTDDLGKSLSLEDFYKKMAAGSDTRTSQVNVNEYLKYFGDFLEAGKDVIHVGFSSGLSGSYNSATIARDMLMERYPDRKLYIVDSLAASSGYGLLMDRLADLRDGGMSIDELYNWANENKLNVHHWFFSTDLQYYVKGGRISKTSAAVGTLLGICPLLNMDNTGHLVPREKVRTKKRVINEIVNRMEQCAEGGLDYSGKCFISQSGCYDDARVVADLVEERFKKLNGKVVINYIGTTIGSHTGPGTVALFFWGNKRED